MTSRIKALLGGAAVLALTAPAITGPAMAQDPIEIHYWQYFFEQRVNAIDALIEQFEADNPDIDIVHTNFPYADYRTRVSAAVPAGQGPHIVQLFYGWLYDFVDAGLIQPLPAEHFDPAEIEADFFPIVQAMNYDGQYYALPTAVRSLALFWNRRLFEEAGLDPDDPPETLDELVEYAQALTQRDGGGNLTQVGLTMAMTAQDHQWWREVLVRQFGGQPYSEDNTEVTYDEAGGVPATQFYVDLIREHGVSAIGFMDEPQAAFRAGRAGMHIDGSFRIGALQDTRGLEWGVAELPSHDGVQSNFASYWVNGITSSTEGEELEAASRFLAYLTSPEAMQLWLEVVGELPARREVALTDENANNPIYGPFIRGLEYAYATEFVNESEQRQFMVDMIDRIILQDMSVEESVNMAAEAEQALLDDFYGD